MGLKAIFCILLPPTNPSFGMAMTKIFLHFSRDTAEMSFMIFVIAIPKEGFVGGKATIPSFWYYTNYRFVIYNLHRLFCLEQ